MATCLHRGHIKLTQLPESVDGCEECLAAGTPSLHLRICLECDWMLPGRPGRPRRAEPFAVLPRPHGPPPPAPLAPHRRPSDRRACRSLGGTRARDTARGSPVRRPSSPTKAPGPKVTTDASRALTVAARTNLDRAGFDHAANATSPTSSSSGLPYARSRASCSSLNSGLAASASGEPSSADDRGRGSPPLAFERTRGAAGLVERVELGDVLI
jgi:hypothetical protein